MSLETVERPEDIGLASEGLNNLKARLLADIENEVCDGVVMMVARKGKIGFYEALGKSDLAAGRDTQNDDIFCLMSVAKSITAAEVLRLADIGKLCLDDKVCKYIPEFAAKGKQNVTIYQLLNHTGGAWPFLFMPPGFTPMDQGDLEKSWRAACGIPLMNYPGTRVRYTPWSGFAVLAEIARRLNDVNKRFNEIMTENWFKPLGMKDTYYGFRGDPARRVPMVQREKSEGLADPAAIAMADKLLSGDSELPGGGAFGTAEDCFRFIEMLRNRGTYEGKRYLSKAICEYAYRNHTGDRPNEAWDYSKEMRGIPQYPANLTVAGGYIRGCGNYFTPLGSTASAEAFAAVGGGSTMIMFDPKKELSVVFLAAGLNEGLAHMQRLSYINDLVFASLTD